VKLPTVPSTFSISKIYKIGSEGSLAAYNAKKLQFDQYKNTALIGNGVYIHPSSKYLKDATSAVLDGFNEVYMVHGTTAAFAKRIMRNGFKINPSGANMFGVGIYQSDEVYTASGYGTGTLIISRVLLGKYGFGNNYSTTQSGYCSTGTAVGYYSMCLANALSSGCHSYANGDGIFVIPESDQIYPEFMIELTSSEFNIVRNLRWTHSYSAPMGPSVVAGSSGAYSTYQPPNSYHRSDNSFYFIIAVVGVSVIGVIICCYARCRSKKAKAAAAAQKPVNPQPITSYPPPIYQYWNGNNPVGTYPATNTFPQAWNN
jgi:hypothetical protein